MATGPVTELSEPADDPALLEQRIAALLRQMTLEEKIGQLALVPGAGGQAPDQLHQALREGRVGSILNEVQVDTVNELQRIAVEESRLGIPLLIGRDVIHGFTTVFPIPLGQAATWNPDLIKRGARIAALEAAAAGVNWTFAPMIDIARDPRWGRVAESLGEDPWLTGLLGAAMVSGFQGERLSEPGSIAACAKHFAGYGACESGKDYNTTNIPEQELRNVHLPPFKAAVDAGAASIMTSFSDLNGVPATGNEMLLKGILRDEWHYDGFVVSDWDSVRQLAVHGLTADDRESAYEAANAGCDVEMNSATYADHLLSLVQEGRISLVQLDTMAGNVLRTKFRLGLFDNPYTDPSRFPAAANPEHLQTAREAALESMVLLKNDHGTLPLAVEALQTLAVIGPLADEPHEQLGTWIFDGDAQYSRTALQSIRDLVGDRVRVEHVRGLETTRSRDRSGFAEAVALAERSDAVILCLGEEAILSGEAHCRAHIGLPGAQEELIAAIAAAGKPIVLVLLAGRPLALERILGHVQALLCAWHPGTMGGPAIADLLFGIAAPSGKLPVTFPRVTGQIPIYYAHKHTGKPPTPETFAYIDDIEPRAPQLSVGNTSFHLDVSYTPLFPFGFGLSYTVFEYANLRVSSPVMTMDDSILITADVTNRGDREAEEVVQLYLRDLAASVTRPVRELKAFEKVRLAPGEQRTIAFRLTARDLAFYGRTMRLTIEPGQFHAWIGGSSTAELRTDFVLTDSHSS
ncbi:MAG: beta-glucosidase BglX [Gemmatimonadota bacterium]|nr:beta-glucosidase BglX [Gemmatimonadota bacterium]